MTAAAIAANRRRNEGGDRREIRCIGLADARRLVVDWSCEARADARLVGELAAEEPSENAPVLARLYLADPTRGRCRRLRRADLAPVQASETDAGETLTEPLCDAAGTTYRIDVIRCGKPYRELRWTRPATGEPDWQATCLREVISRLQAYEPARSLTLRAIARHEPDERISVCRLRAELQRIDASPIVLNKRLREAVLKRIESGDSLSEIALRCGRIKRHPGGHVSGETSWLSRRIGVLPEGGRAETTPWVHSDVLALIAREGLDLCPVEVEAR
jgi:AraC-like DNA-binding protein